MTQVCWTTNIQQQVIQMPDVPSFIKPPDIVVGELRFYRESSATFFFRQLASKLGERNSTKTGHMLGSESIWKYMSEIWGISSPTNRGPKNHLFWWFHNLTTTLTAYISGTKHDLPVHNRASALETTMGLIHRLRSVIMKCCVQNPATYCATSTNNHACERLYYRTWLVSLTIQWAISISGLVSQSVWRLKSKIRTASKVKPKSEVDFLFRLQTKSKVNLNYSDSVRINLHARDKLIP